MISQYVCPISTLCFVGGHLAAKRDNITGQNVDLCYLFIHFNFITISIVLSSGRNSDYHNITDKTCLYEDAGNIAMDNRPKLLKDMMQESFVSILDHDFVFWIGDLNYRIDSSLTLENVFDACANNDLVLLRSLDQVVTLFVCKIIIIIIIINSDERTREVKGYFY